MIDAINWILLSSPMSQSSMLGSFSPNSLLWSVLLAVLTLLLVKSVVQKVAALQQALENIRRKPGGELIWLTPFRPLSLVLSHWFPRTGNMGALKNKFTVYKKYGTTVLSAVIFSNLRPAFWIADADAIRIVSADRHTFPKDVEGYEALNFYGGNIIGVEGADWKRHRAVARPAFNEANTRLVWAESIRVVNEWFKQLDLSGSDITLDTVPIMTQITVLVISAAGFGRRWPLSSDNTKAPTGFKFSLPSALHHTLDGLLVHIATPKFLHEWVENLHIPYLSGHLKDTNQAIRELRLHLLEITSTARAWLLGDQTAQSDAALVRNLVEANMAQEGDMKSLTEDEVLSNVFMFLLAGHESSAHTLSFALTLLALYPDKQRKLYEEAVNIWPEGVPTSGDASPFKDYSRLPYTLATFQEALRQFPPAVHLGKHVTTDVTLPVKHFVPKPDGPNQFSIVRESNVSIPAGSLVMIDILGVQMNPLYWGDDVDEFKPERFIDTETYRWPRDAFLAFAIGQRSCLGQQFALSESVCILATLVRRYEILVPQDLQSLSHEKRKKVMLNWYARATVTPTGARVRLRRRE